MTVASSHVLDSGALKWDRRFALVEPNGKFITLKRVPELHEIRSDFDLEVPSVRIWTGHSVTARQFHLDDDRESLGDYLTCLLNRPVGIVDNPRAGFPDDDDASGPTVVSVATLQTVADLFPEMTTEQARWRFRTNIEVEGVPAFWEDRLFGAKREQLPFQIGGVTFGGVKPCQRCSGPESTSGDRRNNTSLRYYLRGPSQSDVSRMDKSQAVWPLLSAGDKYRSAGRGR